MWQLHADSGYPKDWADGRFYCVGFQKLVIQIYPSATYLAKFHLPCLSPFPSGIGLGGGLSVKMVRPATLRIPNVKMKLGEIRARETINLHELNVEFLSPLFAIPLSFP